MVVQAKRYSKAVGETAIREAYTARNQYNCGSALVVATHGFTRHAKQLAQVNQVFLWDRERLINELLATVK